MKYLKLNFRNAGYFQDSSRSKDFVFDITGQRKRKTCNRQIEPITVNQISNMLHVLMGERPKASLRETIIERQDDIFQIANNSYLKIDTLMTYNKKNKKSYFPKESMTTRKSVYNSYSTSANLIYWKRIEDLLESDLYKEFINLINDLFGYDVIEKHTCQEALLILNKNFLKNGKLRKFIKLLKSKRKMPLVNLMNGLKGKNVAINSNARTLITTNSGIDYITRISGSIIVPIEDSYIEKIKQNKGIATLLDGGFVWIESLIDGEYLSENIFDNYTKVSTISTKTIKIKKK
jgi:hypothetical protein